jgi:hypothetical protein
MKRRAQVAKHASVATKNVESQVLKTRKARLGATERAWEETIAQINTLHISYKTNSYLYYKFVSMLFTSSASSRCLSQ